MLCEAVPEIGWRTVLEKHPFAVSEERNVRGSDVGQEGGDGSGPASDRFAF
jgi:hypothetical protein